MGSELSNQWKDLLSEIGDLLRRFATDVDSIALDTSKLPTSEDSLELFIHDIKRAFHDGVNRAFHATAHEYLKKNFRDQQAIADEFGKKSRTSISHWIANQRIDGVDLAHLIAFHKSYKIPSTKACICSGYAAAITFTQERLQRENSSGSDCLTPEQFELIQSALKRSEWVKATMENDVARASEIEKQILEKLSKQKGEGLVEKTHTHTELKYLIEKWLPSFLICTRIFTRPEVRR